MSPKADRILFDALKLPPAERAELIDRLLTSLAPTEGKAIDERWAQEVEDRIDAFERGEIDSISAKDVFGRAEGSGRDSR